MYMYVVIYTIETDVSDMTLSYKAEILWFEIDVCYVDLP